MIIKPYSTLASDSFVAADYPSLVHYFPFTETSGSTLTDIAGGIVLDDASHTAVIVNADYTLNTGVAKAVISSGTVSSPGTKKIVVLTAGKPGTTAGTFRFGTTTDGSFKGFSGSAASTGPTTKVADGSDVSTGIITSTAGLVGTGSQLQTRASIIDFGTDGTGGTYGLTTLDYDGTTYTSRAAVSLATMTGITSITQACSVAGTYLPYFIQVYYFNTVPTDVKSAMLWCFEEAKLGKKSPYPGWKGRT
jgi:hypothetical protein